MAYFAAFFAEFGPKIDPKAYFSLVFTKTSMKQTNNAIKFLMAQYRAIFKNAYFKGLATAAVVTMGLAAGAAQAEWDSTQPNANLDGILNQDDFGSQYSGAMTADTITKDSEIDLSDDVWLPSFGNATNTMTYASSGTTVIQGATVNIKGETSKYLGFGNLTLTDGAHIILDNGSRGSTNIVGYSSSAANASDAQNTAGTYGTLTVNESAIDVLRGGAFNFNNISLNKANISLSGIGKVDAETNKTTHSPWYFYSNLSAVFTSPNNTGGFVTINDSTVTLNHQSHIGANANIDVSGDTVITFAGEKMSDKEGGYATAFLRGVHENTNVAGNVTVSASRDDSNDIIAVPTLKVQDNAHGAIYATSTTLNEANLAIGQNATFTIDGDWVGPELANAGKHLSTTISLGDVTTDNQGTIIIGNAQSGSTVTVTGNTELTGKVNNFAAITVSGTTATDPAKLTISEDQLLRTKDSDGSYLPQGMFAGSTSQITLSGSAADSAILSLVGTDADGLDLNTDVAFASQQDITNTKTAGKIIVSGHGTIDGEHLVLTKALSLPTNAQLILDGDILELGASNATADSISDLGISAARAHNRVELNTSGDVFVVDKGLTLSRDFYTKDADGNYTTTSNGVGTIEGDNLQITGSTITDGHIDVTGGAWRNEGQTLDIYFGTLNVSAGAAGATTVQGEDEHGTWDYYKNGNPTSLTWTGNFKLNGVSNSAESALVNVSGASGATATLDLTGANVSWGAGTITLQGATNDGDPYRVSATDFFAVGGEGILTITGNQFSDYLDIQNGDNTTTNTKLTVSGGGVLLVEGAVTGAINFNKFTSGAATNAGIVSFNQGGRLVSTGELSLETGVDGSDAGTDVGTDETQSLNLGSGAIIAQGITINNRNPDAIGADADLADNVVTVSGGALAVASRLATSNNEIRFEGATLVLDSNGVTRYGLSATEGGAVSAAKLTFSGSDSTFEVSTGDWTVGANGTLGDVDIVEGGNLLIGADRNEYVRNNVGASLQLDNLSLAGDRGSDPDGNLRIRDGGELTVNTIQAANTSVSVEGGSLTINGRALVAADFDNVREPESLVDLGEEDGIAQAGIDLTGATINVSSQGHFVLGDTAANALVKFTPTATDTVDIVEVNEALDSANITLTGGSEFRLDFASGTASTINGGSGLTAEQAAMLKSKLGTFEGGSYVNVGQLALDMEYDKETLTAQWSDIKDFVQVESDVVNNDIKQLLVQGITSSDEISGHFGAVEADVVGQNTIRVNGNLGLHKAYDGYFASVVNANGQRSPVGLTLTSYSTVQLEGAGTVGTLEGQGTNSDSDVVFAEGEYFLGAATVEGDIRAIGTITVNNDVNVTGNVTVGAAEINQALSAKNVTLEGGANGSSLVTGSLTATEVLTVGTATQQNTLTVANGTVVTRDLVLANASTLQVGVKAADSDDPETAFNEAANYTGSLEAQNVDLGNGGVMVDPVNELQTAFVSFNKFKDASKAQNSMDLGTINGSVYVGNNSVLGIGSTDLASLREYVAEHQHNGALVDYGSILAVNGQATLGANQGIVMTAQMPDDFKAYMTENKWSLNSYNTVANGVYFGNGTAMKVTAEAINSIGAQNNKNALITISGNDGQLIADGGEILISGDVRANRQYTFFTDGNGSVDVVNVDKTTAEAGEGITVSTENGFLLGEINSTTGGVVTLGVNANSRSIMAGASDPVYTTLVAYARGYNGEAAQDGTVAESQRLYDGYTTETVTDGNGQTTTNRVKNYNYSNYFLNESVATGNGAAAESVARLAVFGGAAQAAISAGASTYDAVSGRMGVGANGTNITVADNTQGAALWLAPIYKSSDSDGFDAEGVDYGVDMDLYGVALGADYTLSNGIRFGAMFNVGSGDVDGQGAGSAVSNDFDYYGFAVYGGYSMGALSVVADVSYTVADNDLEGNTSIDKVGASLDSTNLSLGVTGQYQLDFNGTTVTPHAGLRFSKIDLDDYTVDGKDVIANYDADSMSIFSIPVGVTFAKEFTGDAWTVKPSLDLTLTGNFGDDETDGTVHWAGVDNLSTNVSSEVLDNFTYGATLGVAAKTGNFSLGLGVNYTGSSNVDEFGVQANARFVF